MQIIYWDHTHHDQFHPLEFLLNTSEHFPQTAACVLSLSLFYWSRVASQDLRRKRLTLSPSVSLHIILQVLLKLFYTKHSFMR